MEIDFICRHRGTRAVITDGTQSLRPAIARRLAREVAPAIVLAGRGAETGEPAAAEIRALGSECVFAQADIGEAGDCVRLMPTAIGTFPRVNALVNSATTADCGTLVNNTLDLCRCRWISTCAAPCR